MSGPHAALRAALDEGRPLTGTFVMEFATPGVGSIAAGAGADFVFVDQQHTGWSIGQLTPVIWGCHAADLPVGVRVPAIVPWMIGAALDAGASMIMVPAVDDAAQARAVVAAVRYPPAGDRALTFNFAADRFRPPADAAGELRRRDQDTVVIVQIETAAGLANARDIAAVDGVDVLWVGDNDLAASLGVPGDFTSVQFADALAAVARAAAEAGKTAGFTTADVAVGRRMRENGYRVLCFGNDIKVFGQALSAGLHGLRDDAFSEPERRGSTTS